MIHEWPGDAGQDQPDTTRLESGQSRTIPVGEWHSFTAKEPCTCLEIYEAAPVEEDIIRRTVGGNLNLDKNEAGLP